MNELRPENISVIDPINPAIDRVKLMLFQPFDLGRWFVIGFCAFLANLGKGNGGGGGGGGSRHRGGGYSSIHEDLNQAKYYFQDNFSWIVPLTVFIVLLVICIWLVTTWLSSRGRFMFLHCVAENKAEVKLPWTKYRDHANNLFAFRIVLGLIGFAAIILPSLMIFGLVFMSPVIITVLGSVMISILIIVLIITLLIIAKFTTDFVVPIMFLRTTSCTAAWREFLTILSVNKARFALYVLFQIAIGMVIGIIIVMGMCFGTCCLCGLGLLLLIPYIGTVILLPLPVFMRSYSLYYLQQFGPQFDAFSPDIITVQAEPSQNIQ
jgi:hypothetical protein